MSSRPPGNGPWVDPVASYAAGPTDRPLDDLTVWATLDRAVRRDPERVAMIDHPTGRSWTYRKLGDAVDRCATGLYDLGVRRGDRVGVWTANSPEWVLVQFATAKLGAILVTINPAYRSSELAHALRNVQVSTLFAATSFKSTDYAELLGQVRPDCPDLRTVVHFGTDEWDQVTAGSGEHDSATAALAASLAPDDPINIQFTSGTTGAPKGATLSHKGTVNNARFFGEGLHYTAEDRVCVPVPFYHCFGMVMGTLTAFYHGATLIIPGPWFDARQTLVAAAEYRCTSLFGVPTMFIAELEIMDELNLDLTSLRTGIMGGSPCPVEVMKRVIHDMGMHEITICFGMTENSPVATQTKVDDDLRRRTETVGVPLPHMEVAVKDPASGEIVEHGVVGEACFRAYSVMLGYWEDPAQTAEAVDADGWLHTGDLAVMDTHGYLSVVGRLKDMVIRGGENIYPREIEEFLITHPDIIDVQVVGVPDERLGEELVAWIKLRPGAPSLDAAGLRDYCADRLSRHKIPRYVKLVEDFPMTVTGKVRKIEMREISRTELEGQAGRAPR